MLLSRLNRLPTRSADTHVNPVAFPPGRLRLPRSFSSGSQLTTTIGIFSPFSFAASSAGSPAATNTSILRPANSRASTGSCSYSLLAKRDSTTRFFPSSYPSSRRGSRKSASLFCVSSADPNERTPSLKTLPEYCATDDDAHRTSAMAKTTMFARRLMVRAPLQTDLFSGQFSSPSFACRRRTSLAAARAPRAATRPPPLPSTPLYAEHGEFLPCRLASSSGPIGGRRLTLGLPHLQPAAEEPARLAQTCTVLNQGRCCPCACDQR